MQTTKTVKTAWLLAVLLCCGLGSAQAQTITNTDAGLSLNAANEWLGSLGSGAPTSVNVAVWNHTDVNNLTEPLGGNLSWAGIQILDPGSNVVISADGNSLTLGASGIDMSAATTNLILACPVVLGANQTWTVANTRSLTVTNTLPAASATLLTLTGGGTNNFTAAAIGGYTGNISLTNGVLEINATSGNTTLNSDVGTGIITNNGATLRNNNGNGVGNVIVWNGNCTLDCNNTSKAWEGEWQGSSTTTVLLTNMITSGNTYTVGGNGNGGGDMNYFTGSVIISSVNSDASPTAGTFRFNNGGGSPNTGNPLMTLNLGQGLVHFSEKNSGTTTSFGALLGGPGTMLVTSENYIITNSVGNDVFSGTILSTATFTKNGAGQFTWNNFTNNVYSGITTINAGILQVGDGVTVGAGSLGTGAISLLGGALVYNKPDAFSITNKMSGSGGSFIKTNVNVMTYYGTNSATGSPTIISQGTLALATNLVGASLMTSPISVANGATFDISQDTVFTLSSALSGYGTVNGPLAAVTGSTISPGSASVAGTLTINNSLTESGGVANTLALSLSGGDLINVVGNLTLTGVNSFTLTALGGGTIPNGTYPLIEYSGTLTMTGNVTNNFTVTAVGVVGTLTNITTTTPPEIAVVITPAPRSALNLTWTGDGGANNWDTATSNWVNNATSYAFQTGDSVLFNDSAFPNTNVDVAVGVLPASVTVSNTRQYFLTGNGSINGATGLTKTNSGTLSISATNGYTGPTIVGGGTLELFNVANGLTDSAIGAALNASSNLVFYGTTLKYSGVSAATDRGATLNGAGVTVDVVPGVNLTESGILTGSGVLTKVDSGTLTLAGLNANSYIGGTVISNGVLAAGNITADASGFGASAITFKGGTLTLYNSTGDDGSTVFAFSNPLIVSAGQTGNLAVFERGLLTSTLTGGGTLNVSASGARGAFAGDWSAFTGIINVITNNVLTNGTAFFRIDTYQGYSNAVFNLNDGADLDGGGSSGVYGTTEIFDIGELDGTSLATLGSPNASKCTEYPTWRVGWKNTTSTFAGTIANPTYAASSFGVASITKVGTGTWFLLGQNTYTGQTVVSNGVLALSNNPTTHQDGSINQSATIDVKAGAVIDVTGETVNPGTMALGSQVLQGDGTVRGSLNTASGTVSPGGGINGSIGTLTVTGNISLGGTAWMKINRDASQTGDKLVSSLGTIYYGGTLVVTNIGGPLQIHDRFTLFSANGSGLPSTLVLPAAYTWDTSQLDAYGYISVTGIAVPPTLSKVDYSQLKNGSITFYGAYANATNYPFGAFSGEILTSTNMASPLSSWTVVSTGLFDDGTYAQPPGQLIDIENVTPYITITVDPTLPQSFYLLKVVQSP
jgi:autotransporter-associated beta strand protein